MGTYRLNQMGIYSQTFPVPLKYRRQSVLQPPNKKAPSFTLGAFLEIADQKSLGSIFLVIVTVFVAES